MEKSMDKNKLDSRNARIKDRSIIGQKHWQFIKEMNSYSDEQLDSPAIIDESRTYTYRQLFRAWERYAAVFSGLGITGKNHSRVFMFGNSTAEPLIAIYALNMTGASFSAKDLRDMGERKRVYDILKEEKVTDIILTDYLTTPEFARHMLKVKSELGIRNLIILSPRLKGELVSKEEKLMARLNHKILRSLPGLKFMDDLLVRYEAAPIEYGKAANAEDAFILHTSGTSNGISKPVPLSDRAVNASILQCMEIDLYRQFKKQVRILLNFDYGSTFALVNATLAILGMGGTLVATYFSFFRPFEKYLEKHKCNVLHAYPFLFDIWDRSGNLPDLSYVEAVIAGGEYVSPESRSRVNEILAKCGSKAKFSVGYGLSETAGLCCMLPTDSQEDSIGFIVPGIRARIFDEEEGRFYEIEDGCHTGVLYIATEALSSGRVDGKVYFQLEEFDGVRYLCTNDVVTVGEDGSLKYIGRANKYFVNNEGVRFDAGLVETGISRQQGIRQCALAPEYAKNINDTVPVLYVVTDSTGQEAPEVIRRALINVFINEGIGKESNLPALCVAAGTLPVNTRGKVDTYRILQGEVTGQRYFIRPLREKGELKDVTLEAESAEGPVGFMFSIPKELEGKVDNFDPLAAFGANAAPR